MEHAEAFKLILSPNKVENEGITNSERPVPLSGPPAQIAQQAIAAAPVLAIRENRIRAQQARHRLLEQVREERAREMTLCEGCRRPREAHPWEEMVEGKDKEGMPTEVRIGCDSFREVPGGTTGLIVRKLKSTGVEYALDTGLLNEYREHEKQIAIEMGQWQESQPQGSISIQIVAPRPDDPDQTPRVSFAAPDAIEAPAVEDGEEDGITDIALRQE